MAISSLGANKSPGPDIFTAAIFKIFWTTLEDDIMNMIHDFFYSGVTNASLNETYICLIPKDLDARMVSDYRPISIIGIYLKTLFHLLVFFDIVLSMSFYWCKIGHHFKNFSLLALVAIWRCFCNHL